MNFDDYQNQAMATNSRPRLFTETQVRAIVVDALDSWGAETLDDLLDRHTGPFNMMLYHIYGLLEEAGETAGKVKKLIRDEQGRMTKEHEDAIALEVGDAQWYVSAIADAMARPLSEVAQGNLDKLADRARRGVLGGSGDNR